MKVTSVLRHVNTLIFDDLFRHATKTQTKTHVPLLPKLSHENTFPLLKHFFALSIEIMVAIIRTSFCVALVASASAFAPSQQSISISQRQSSSHLQMGLFDFFSEEAKADRKAADEKRKEEEEEGYQKMMQRRT